MQRSASRDLKILALCLLLAFVGAFAVYSATHRTPSGLELAMVGRWAHIDTPTTHKQLVGSTIEFRADGTCASFLQLSRPITITGLYRGTDDSHIEIRPKIAGPQGETWHTSEVRIEGNTITISSQGLEQRYKKIDSAP